MPIKSSYFIEQILIGLFVAGILMWIPSQQLVGSVLMVVAYLWWFALVKTKRERRPLNAIGIFPFIWIVGGILMLTIGFISVSRGINLAWPPKKENSAQKSETNPFNVEVRSALVSDSGPLTLYMVTYPSAFGQTASPIFYLTNIRITNNQDISCTVNDIKLAASKELVGPWEELVPIPLKSVNLYAIGIKTPYPKILKLKRSTYRLGTPMKIEDMKHAALLNPDPVLESKLTNNIPPHQSIEGWAAFDSRTQKGLTPGQIYFRLTIQDTAGRTGIYTTPHPIPTNAITDQDGGGLLVTGVLEDISKYHVKYYSDPINPPKHH